MIHNSSKGINIKHKGKKHPARTVWSYVPSIRFRGSTLTHNHPDSSGLSLADLEFFLMFRVRELRAKCKNGDVFSMTNIDLSDKKRDALLDLFYREQKFAKNVFSDKGEFFQQGYVFSEVFNAMKKNVNYVKYID